MFRLVGLARLELATPCLQIDVSSWADIADLGKLLSVSDRCVPELTGGNGTLLAR
jgi:hypothetical protein